MSDDVSDGPSEDLREARRGGTGDQRGQLTDDLTSRQRGHLTGRQTSDLSIRRFIEADEPEVTSWFADAGELRFFAGPRLTWPLDDGQWRSIRLDPSVTAWTAIFGDNPTPIGHGELVAESSTTARLARLAISPRERGRGVGRAMMIELIDEARSTGHTLLTLNVHQDNTAAIRAYRGFGFEPTGSALAHASVRMELPLA
jgi:GNAT superfamily N-acetyltransferase